jgi:hypothetical protein
MIKVFEGGDGSTSGGRSERSRESGDLLPDDARERDGVGIVTCMLAAAIMYSPCVRAEVLLLTVVVIEERPDSPGVLYQACSGVETFQLPHPSCSRAASASGAVQSLPRPLRASELWNHPRTTPDFLHLVRLVWAVLHSPPKTNPTLCCVVLLSSIGRTRGEVWRRNRPRQ